MQAQVEKVPGSIALAIFCRKNESEREYTADLRGILEATATTGKYWHDWSQLKHLVRFRLAQVMQEYNESHMSVDVSTPNLVRGETFTDLLDRLLQGLDSFINGAPFTSQRLCELLVNPKETYVNLDKLALAFEKLLLVTTTEPASTEPYPSFLLLSTKQDSPSKDQATDEGKSEVFTVNGSRETNGMHKEMQAVDVEMVDVEGLADQPSQVQVDQPAITRGVSSDTTQTNGPEEPSNGHIGSESKG